MSENVKYIIELSMRDVKIIAQLLHMAMLQDDDLGAYPKVAAEVFRELSIQTPGLSDFAQNHGVFINDLTSPESAVRFVGRHFIPVI